MFDAEVIRRITKKIRSQRAYDVICENQFYFQVLKRCYENAEDGRWELNLQKQDVVDDFQVEELHDLLIELGFSCEITYLPSGCLMRISWKEDDF